MVNLEQKSEMACAMPVVEILRLYAGCRRHTHGPTVAATAVWIEPRSAATGYRRVCLTLGLA
jgi:hypothetical protein